MATSASWNAAGGATACDVDFSDGQRLLSDVEPDVGGLGAPAPHDLLDAALAACTALTLQLYATRKGLAVQRLRVEVSHAKEGARNVMTRAVHITGRLTDEERTSLLRVADACPVHKTLTSASAIVTTAHVLAPS